jgi:alkanesulfonate monooxygenase SsuD/methylene tetrahydromethanopterin reductase-like flavin-dependent oxidoreductase (luciferase family)
VRVFEQFSTLDLLSGGRAEIMAGRGSFIESFPLFGYDLADYDELFVEKLDLLLRLRESEHVTWAGRHRAPLDGLGVYPRPLQDLLPVWIAVGGNPTSAARTGSLGLPMALAIIGGMPEQFAPFAEIHRRAAREAGHDVPALSINSHGFIARTSQEAADVSWPPFEAMMTKIGRERGWPPMTREQFDASRSLRGANFVGSPQEVAEKILFQHGIFGHDRFLLQLTVGSLDHVQTMRAIELFGTEVAPLVRAEMARRSATREPTESLTPTA